MALALACAAAELRAQESAAPETRVYGVEVERAEKADRLLVLTVGDVSPQLEEVSSEEVLLRIVNATLDARMPRRLVPAVGAAIRAVSVAESAGPPPSVEIRVRRGAGLAATISRRGTIVALEIARPLEPVAARPEANVRMNLRDRPLVDLVREVQRVTQRRFVWDDRLQGSVSVIVQDPVTPGEALEILNSTLLSKGFAAVPSPDGTLLVLPLDEARTRAPKEARALSEERAGLITTLVRFRAANAEQLVNLLAPFAGGTLTVIPYMPTNGAILVGPENAMHRWLELARSLDETSARDLAVIRPRHRTAAELFAVLSEAVLDPLTGRARAELFLDERTNALLVRAEPSALARLRVQIAELDTAPEERGSVLVIRPRFADPEKLAAQLEALAKGGGGAGAGAAERAGGIAPGSFTVARHPSTGSLLISGDAATQHELRALIDELDVEPPLIAIEAQVLEVSATGKLALGFDAFVPSTDPSNPGRSIFGVGIGDPFDQSADALSSTFIARYARAPVLIPVIGPGGIPVNVALPREIVQLKAAEGEVRVRLLMQPRLMTLGGEEHEFTAGLNVPVPTAATGSAEGGVAGDPLTTRVNVERQDVGIRLRVKPVVGEAGGVRIGVDLEVTNLQPSAGGSRADIGPELGRRTLQAQTRVDDGGVAVLGMLLERGSQTFETGAPGLKDVPLIGNLLKQSLDQEGERHLLLTIQARILRGADERLADTIRLRTAHERALARSGALGADGSAWALLIATRTRREDAEALAASLGEVAGRRARVVPWKWADAQRFDVVLAGFARVLDAADALPALEELGWQAELVALPSTETAKH